MEENNGENPEIKAFESKAYLKKYMKDRYHNDEEFKARIKKHSLAWREKNKERYKQKDQEWRLKHKVRLAEYQRVWSQKKRDRLAKEKERNKEKV